MHDDPSIDQVLMLRQWLVSAGQVWPWVFGRLREWAIIFRYRGESKLAWSPLPIICKPVKGKRLDWDPLVQQLKHWVCTDTLISSLLRFEWILVWLLSYVGQQQTWHLGCVAQAPAFSSFSSDYTILCIQLEQFMEVWRVLWMVMVAITHQGG